MSLNAHRATAAPWRSRAASALDRSWRGRSRRFSRYGQLNQSPTARTVTPRWSDSILVVASAREAIHTTACGTMDCFVACAPRNAEPLHRIRRHEAADGNAVLSMDVPHYALSHRIAGAMDHGALWHFHPCS